jgi:hypothetical protein
MIHDERLESYALQVAFRASRGGEFIAHVSEDNPLLTPAMRRRLRKRKNRGHSHRELPLIPNSGPDGKWKRVPCPKCRPRGAGPAHFIGGSVGWLR